MYNDDKEARTGLPFGRASRPALPAAPVESVVGPGRWPGRWTIPGMCPTSETRAGGLASVSPLSATGVVLIVLGFLPLLLDGSDEFPFMAIPGLVFAVFGILRLARRSQYYPVPGKS